MRYLSLYNPCGKSDFRIRPFHSQDLLARVRSLLRRGEAWLDEEPERFEAEGLTIDYSAREVWRSGKRLDLTPTEFDLLAYFSKHQGRILNYEQLAESVYGPGTMHGRHDLFVHISRLRKKIEPNPKK